MAEIGSLKLINESCFDVLLLEGVEGVYKPLAHMLHGEDYRVRSTNGSTTECHYLVIVCEWNVFTRFEITLKSPGAVVEWTTLDRYILHVQPYILPSTKTEEITILSDAAINFYLHYPVQHDDPGPLTTVVQSGHFTWYNRLRVPEFNIRECFQRSIAVLRRPRTKFLTDQGHSCVIEALHRQEIRSLRQIKRNGEQTDGSAALELWESKEKVFRLEIENVKTELKDYGNIIFQLVIGFYTVFHGVLFTVVSQADSPFTCRKIRISYFVSAIISFITIAGVIKNVKAMEHLKKLMHEHKARLLAVCRWQSTLKREGNRFEYGRATLDYKPMPTTKAWWLPAFLPLKALFYTFLILMCSIMICYVMRLLQCS